MFQVHNLKDTLCLLEEDVCFFELILLNEFIGDVGQLKEKKRNLILVYLYFFIIQSVEAVVLVAVGR